MIRIINGHTGHIMSVTFNRSCTYLISGGKDNTIKIWEIISGRILTTLTEHI